ncbi:hypothetical protein FSP39_002200 [Pinctada imbricata]|uniref:B box-type domain-containing protein n=1 Tax=Pinctada imbricata TaxID=66713 RepID=A0AA88YS39_PINIB|nr:hypothetical protein FSP39_002200 [Pinctada imbricata]
MAFASTMIGAQEAIIKSCDICEEGENVNWYCVDCAQNLCDGCEKGHKKIATCKNHQIVSISEGISITKRNVSSLCKEHSEGFSFFCRSCEKNICSKCLSASHKSHNFVELRDYQSELQDRLEAILKEKEGEKELITQSINASIGHEKKCEETLTQNYAAIDDMVRSIQIAATEEGSKMKLSLKSGIDGRLTEAKENRQKMEAQKNLYDKEIQAVQQELRIQTPPTFNQFFKASTYKLQSLKPLVFPLPVINTFTAGHMQKELIRDMIGKDGEEVHAEAPPQEMLTRSFRAINQNLETVNTFNKLDSAKNCYSICISSEGYIWLGGKGCVYKMSSDCSKTNHQIPARESRLTCDYITCLQSGDAVVSYGYGSHFLDRFTTDGKRVEFTDLSPRHGYDIAKTYDDEVVVSACTDYLGLLSDLNSWSLIICSKEGKKLKDIKMGENIGNFGIDVYGNIIKSAEASLSLTILDRRGTVLKTIPTKKPNLQRISCDSHGNIVGVSGGGKEVRVISDDGKEERCFTVKCRNGINDICIDSENRLLILMDKKRVVVGKYL